MTRDMPIQSRHSEISAEPMAASSVVVDLGQTNQAIVKPVEGYPRLAARMGQLPETAIIRRFAALNARNVLYLQAELVRLEQQLSEHELADSRDPEGVRSRFAKDWYWLSVSDQDDQGDQWSTFLQIREKLRDYNYAVLQQHAMAGLPQPKEIDLRDLQGWLHGENQGQGALNGADSHIWGSPKHPKSHALDLIALRSRHNGDPFSKWVTRSFIYWYYRVLGRRFQKASPIYFGEAGYEESRLLALTSMVTSVVASILPVAAITVLYSVRSMPARLGIIAAFNLVFSICLHRFSTAKQSEVFAATAAFSAVLVVFVGTSGSNSVAH